MQAIGLNRVFGSIITSPGLNPEMLPTLSFFISILIAFATGTSWGTMTIMFPLIVVPSYEASGGDPNIVYGVIAGILAGAVAGDHASPISDTTILGAMASECKLLNHVKTQAPYAFIVALWSILVGTIPSGMGTFNNGVCIALGFFAMVFMAVIPAAAPLNASGRYDIFTELYLMITKDEYLLKLKADAKQVFETGETLLKADDPDETTKLTDEMTKPFKEDAEGAEDPDVETSEDDPKEVPSGVADSTISAISEVGVEDPLPESGEKRFGESVISA